MAYATHDIVTFLFIAADTAAAHSLPSFEPMLIFFRQAVRACGGNIVKTGSHAAHAVFPTAPAAVSAALATYWAGHTPSWGDTPPLHVRIALHTGPAHRYGNTYVGATLNHTLSLLAASHSDQILLSQATADLVQDHLPPGTFLRNLGEQRLKDMTRPECIFQLLPPDQPIESALPVPLAAFPSNLPILPTPLIGRDHEVAAIRHLLCETDRRLLTLLGSSGTGKTRLSLQVAVELIDAFTDGVFFVPLAPITHGELVLETIAQILSVKENSTQALLDTLTQFLRDRQLLLILDNVEQLLEAMPLLSELLLAAPRLKIMVTSQVRLGLSDEYVFPVPPLSLPNEIHNIPLDQLLHYPAVALFVERAQIVQPDFSLTEANAIAVADLCRRLEGLPLAIELVAAYNHRFPPEELLTQLTRYLTETQRRIGDELTHKQLLHTVLNWSYALLDPHEQRLLARLGVFSGGCTLEAVQSLAQGVGDQPVAIAEQMVALHHKNLLLQEEWHGHEPRYLMLDMVQQYAREQLSAQDEAAQLQQWHTSYYAQLAEMAATHMTDAEQQLWLNRLENEIHNLRAALDRVIAKRDEDVAVRMSGALWRFWYTRGYFSEGRRWLAAALACAESVSGEMRAKALTGASVLAFMQGDYTHAKHCAEENLAVFQASGDLQGVANTLSNLGVMASELGEYTDAKGFLERCLRLRCELGDEWGIAVTENNLAQIAEQEGADAEAEKLYHNSLERFRTLGDTGNIANVTTGLGWVYIKQGRYQQARQVLLESLNVSTQLDYHEGIAFALEGVARLSVLQGQPIAASRLLGVIERIYERIGITRSPLEQARHAQTVQSIRAQIPETAWLEAWNRGRAMSTQQAVQPFLQGES